MPRIDAPNVEEHIRRQTDRLLDAASALFKQKGYRNTDMGDIAAAIKLGRSSLYRYYPNKDHILLACIRREMEPLLERFERLNDSIADPVKRVEAWVDLQIESGTSPDHATLEMISEIQHADQELKQEMARLRQLPVGVLSTALSQIDCLAQRDVSVMAKLLFGMVHAAAMHILEYGDEAVIREELGLAVNQVLMMNKPT